MPESLKDKESLLAIISQKDIQIARKDVQIAEKDKQIAQLLGMLGNPSK